jgi:hypothetical protein
LLSDLTLFCGTGSPNAGVIDQQRTRISAAFLSSIAKN